MTQRYINERLLYKFLNLEHKERDQTKSSDLKIKKPFITQEKINLPSQITCIKEPKRAASVGDDGCSN